MTYFPNNVRRRADGCLEKAVWASNESRLQDLIERMEASGWIVSGEPFWRGRHLVAKIIFPAQPGAVKQRAGWQ